MDRYSRIVFGFHGTDPALALRLVTGEVPLSNWNPSTNEYDWLGHGIYFWEYAPERALTWANRGGVVGAIIDLGICMDFTDVRYTNLLSDAYSRFAADCRRRRKALPRNRGKRRELDCAVINYATRQFRRETGLEIQTVRGAFLEGDPVFPGCGLLRETHIQIAVRDRSCIIGLFRPTHSRGVFDAEYRRRDDSARDRELSHNVG
jgi:hypothetical protein